MNLQSFCFPVEEREVYFSSNSNFYDWKTNGLVQRPSTKIADKYKAIIRSDTNKIISIVNRNYKLVPNQVLIDQLLDELRRTDQKYEIEPHHSFVRDNRMRLYHLIFIEAKGDTSWTNKQLKSKAERLEKIFGYRGDNWNEVKPYYLIMSPRPSKNLDTSGLPLWMIKNDDLVWLPLELPNDLVKVTRCDKNSRPSVGGDYWKIG